MNDTEITNAMKATMFLIEAAKDWEQIALDPSLPEDVRVQAGYWSVALRQEMRPQ